MYDYILKNGSIINGNREKPYKSNLYIKDGKIDKISEELDGEANRIIDCEGLLVTPGFIDLHTHSDACVLNEVMGQSMINQGVTTQIGGNCGISLVPSNDEKFDEINSFYARTIEIVPDKEHKNMYSMKDYAEIGNNNDLLINNGLLIGHGTLRAAVMGFDDRKATDEELEEMKSLLDKQLSEGAVGMSLGLIYPPSSYGDVDEFVELSKVIRDHNGILTVHMRNENAGVFDSVDEMLEVAEKSGVHLHISHLKLMGKPNWGKAKQLLQQIEDSRKKGAKVTCDQYPYIASSTGLAALVPGWALSGGNSAMIKNLEENSEKLRNDIKETMDIRGGPSRVLITSTNGKLPELDGKNIEEISEILDLDPVDAVREILIKCNGAVAAVYFSMSEDDVLEIMQSMDISIGSDGADFGYDLDHNPHPRNFGTFPKFLEMVKENDLMPIEDAIYKISGLPAEILHWENRGFLEEGNIADITVVDYENIKEVSNFVKSTEKPIGIKYVFVNGELTLEDKELTGSHKGQVVTNNN